MVITPKIRGFICTTAHPEGCSKRVSADIDYISSKPKITNGPKTALIIGASNGYGLASRITLGFGADCKTIGIMYEKPPTEKRTASPGWYNTSAFERQANSRGLYAKSLNMDAFSDKCKQEVVELIKRDLPEKIDLVVYSLASPRRQDPKTGTIYQSCLKPIGQSYLNKTVDIFKGTVNDIELHPASSEEVDATVAVMGGEDWQLWLDCLQEADLLAPNAKTLAYSYIGPELTFPIYRAGTIGRAKEHLEATAEAITAKLKEHCAGSAYVSVNKGLVTQASSAIPVVPLYISILYKVMKAHNTHEGTIEQMWRLYNDKLYGNLELDTNGRIRVDELELDPKIQQEVEEIWQKINSENLDSLADLTGYKRDFNQLFGFQIDDVDYNASCDLQMSIPSLTEEEKPVH